MPEKRGNIAIRRCFLTGSWEGPIISCYAKHLFNSLKTCDVSELVSPFPLRHVPWYHEKGTCACWPSRKNKTTLLWLCGDKWQLQGITERRWKIGPSFKVSDVFMTFEKKKKSLPGPTMSGQLASVWLWSDFEKNTDSDTRKCDWILEFPVKVTRQLRGNWTMH